MTRVPVVVSVALCLGAASAQSPQEPAFHGGTDLVSVYATVFDASGRWVPGLTRDDFEILDNGLPQPLALFAGDNQPITIVVMLDRSGSMVSNFTRERDAAAEFVGRLTDRDKARVGSFSTNVQIDPETFTNDREALRRILDERLQPAGMTPLWNATAAAMTALEHETGRRVVLVFTDGFDNPESPGPNVTLDAVRSRALSDEIMLYAIGLADACRGGDAGSSARVAADASAASTDRGALASTASGSSAGPQWQRRIGVPRGGQRGSPPPGRGLPPTGRGGPVGPTPPVPMPRGPGDRWPDGGLVHGRGSASSDSACTETGPDPALRELAADGGGAYYELRGTDDLGATFGRVADELRHQYLLAFRAPLLDGKAHVLQVRVRQPGLAIRARRGYLAVPHS